MIKGKQSADTKHYQVVQALASRIHPWLYTTPDGDSTALGWRGANGEAGTPPAPCLHTPTEGHPNSITVKCGKEVCLRIKEI